MMYYGYIPSILDGSELDAGNLVSQLPIPRVYENRNIRPIQDQGALPICVSVSLLDSVLWNMNFKAPNSGDVNVTNSIFWDRCPNSTRDGMQPKSAFELLVGGNIDPRIDNLFSMYARVGSLLVAKRCIFSSGLIMVGLPVRSDSNEFWNGGSVNNILGWHAVNLVGYDDDRMEFVLRNSWGRSWGERGHWTISYSDFNRHVRESWVLIK